ncbi:NF-kappa-B inhibitor-interacting Ras-like protein isoform X1 [Anabrus simplex]|uniref:NF-kappa-B inhibitor-interacting Ras-like protein isoform X1 n=1 Tax=Anabrus simplex TaxID=316456 RepID=UPI0035A335E8
MGKTTRVVVCGLRSVGKTAILEQLIYGNVTKTAELHSTIEDIYVANIETDRGTREKVRFYDTAGLDYSNPASREQSQLARQYIGLADGYVLVYDTDRPESLDVLVSLKKDIDRNRDKKEVTVIVLGNRTKPMDVGSLENTASKASHWAAREKIKHYEVNAMERSSLYEPFVYLASRLNPPPNKSTFPQLSMVRKTISRPDPN